jgi:DNA-directed RNA polymerase subunit RPC12/RpoP
MNCPKCGQPMTLDTANALYRCKTCFHKVPQPQENLDQAMARMRTKGARPSVAISYRGDLDNRARSLFESAQDALWREQKPEAIRLFQQAIDLQRDFTDAHLWIAKTTDSAQQKRHHLDIVLAYDPGHAEALRMLMVMTGRMTEEEAEKSKRSDGPILRRADTPVKVETEALLCPVCGGRLTVDGANNRVVCAFCGHVEALKQPTPAEQQAFGDVLGMALMERRAQDVRWVVGEHVMHCHQCGAERTLTPGRMSMQCPFCGSNQVVQQDALGTLERPSWLIPFRFNEESAKMEIRTRLKGVDQKLSGLLDDNKVVRATMEGVYLPFWLFDAQIEVTRTVIDSRTPQSRNQVRTVIPYQTMRIPDGMTDIPVCAVKSPPLTRDLGEYDTSARVPYNAKLLATYPAALYDLDFEEASLAARGVISQHMRERHGQSKADNITVNIFSSVLQMTFTLALLPVWIATLYERDGDLRTALVNGQTGKVVLGKARKAT